MIHCKTFKKALYKVKSINIQMVNCTESVIAKTSFYDRHTKEFKFMNESGDMILKFHWYNVDIITRLPTDNERYVFLVQLKTGIDCVMEFFMRDGYSFFAADTYTRENVQAVLKVVPKYLSDFNGKTVKIMQTTVHEGFTTWNFEMGCENSVITNEFIIGNFGYEIEKLSGMAVIDCFDYSGVSRCKILDVILIMYDFNTKNKVIISTSSSKYVLETVD